MCEEFKQGKKRRLQSIANGWSATKSEKINLLRSLLLKQSAYTIM